MTKKLSQELSRTETRFLGALSRLDEFLLYPQARVRSGPALETFQISNRENQGTNEDLSQNDPYPEVEISLSQSSQELSPEETFNISAENTLGVCIAIAQFYLNKTTPDCCCL